jgi:hypothetical protein
VEVSYLTWTEDGLLRQVVYLGEREDKPSGGGAARDTLTGSVRLPLPEFWLTWRRRSTKQLLGNSINQDRADPRYAIVYDRGEAQEDL